MLRQTREAWTKQPSPASSGPTRCAGVKNERGLDKAAEPCFLGAHQARHSEERERPGQSSRALRPRDPPGAEVKSEMGEESQGLVGLHSQVDANLLILPKCNQ